jgi:hypothetical protein
MTVEHPVYRFDFFGQKLTLDAREQVEAVYREWTETDQCVFFADSEELAVGDTMRSTRFSHDELVGVMPFGNQGFVEVRCPDRITEPEGQG